jgi:hypothetical protein
LFSRKTGRRKKYYCQKNEISDYSFHIDYFYLKLFVYCFTLCQL